MARTRKWARGAGEGLAVVGAVLLKDQIDARREEAMARLRAEFGIKQTTLENEFAEARDVRQGQRDDARQEKALKAVAGEHEAQRQFEAGRPRRDASGRVAEIEGLMALARKYGIEYTSLPGVGGGHDGRARYVDVQEKGVDQHGFQTTVTRSYVELTDPKTKLPRRIPAEEYESMREQAEHPTAPKTTPSTAPAQAPGAVPAPGPSPTERALLEKRGHMQATLRTTLANPVNQITRSQAESLRTQIAGIDKRLGRAAVTTQSGEQAMQKLQQMRARVIELRAALGKGPDAAGLMDVRTRQAMERELDTLERQYSALKPRQQG